MIVAFLSLLVMSVTLFIIAYRRKDNSHINGLKTGKKMLINFIPLILLAFLVAGFIDVVIPPSVIKTWLGNEAGWKGIFIGTFAGALIPGGPYVVYPIIGAVLEAGTSIGTAVAAITGWAMLGLGRLPFELAILGTRFTIIRICIVIFVPFICGTLAQLIFGNGF